MWKDVGWAGQWVVYNYDHGKTISVGDGMKDQASAICNRAGRYVEITFIDSHLWTGNDTLTAAYGCYGNLPAYGWNDRIDKVRLY